MAVGKVVEAQGRYGEAEELYECARGIFIRKLGADHELTQ
ncbi:MAG: tetratricopeptide repeat protein [Gammaproteobacteria bacterium]|nr:tetratricopeptide repeat protein [Gammaproteobacteria bacterium]